MRDKQDILVQFEINEDLFQLLYDSYHTSLSNLDNNDSWNIEIDDFARSISALTEEEIELALTDLQRAILNRIIVNRSMTQTTHPLDHRYQPLTRVPPINQEIPSKEGVTRNFFYRFFTNPIVDRQITYHQMLVCYEPDSLHPCYIIAAESSGNVEGAFFCTTRATQRKNSGRSEKWLNAEIFFTKALETAHQYFDAPSS